MNPTSPSPHAPWPHDVAGWVAQFQSQPVPVLAASVQAVAQLAQRDAEGDDGVDAQLIAKAVGADPLMVLRVLRHSAEQLTARKDAHAETLTEALVLMGITPFFRHFSALPTVEAQLGTRPEALAGLQAVLERGRRAARFALGFAVQRMDGDAPLVHQAALLHDFAELLLWVHAPEAAQGMAQRQAADPQLRSTHVQREVLGVELLEVQLALMDAWHLPELLRRLNDDHHASHPSVRCVHLALRVARHTHFGWDNAALPDDVHEVAELLNLSAEPARRLLIDLDS